MALAIDTEGTGLFIHKGCRPFTISACSDEGDISLWKFRVDPETREVIYEQDIIDDFLETVHGHEELIFHNANYDLQALLPLGLDYNELFDTHEVHDTMVMSHAFESKSKHGLKDQALYRVDYPDDDEKDLEEAVKKVRPQAKKLGWAIADSNNPHPHLVGTQKEWWRADYWLPEEFAIRQGLPNDHPYHSVCDKYAGKDAERTLALYFVFKELLSGDLHAPYERSRLLIRSILNMQSEGVPVKPRRLSSVKIKYSYRRDQLLKELADISGEKDFNPRSPKQLQSVLFQKFGFEPVKYGKSGPSTDKDVIKALITTCPLNTKRVPAKYRFLSTLQRYRKTNTTLQYVENYDRHSQNEERVLHPSFKQAHTGTTRLSCENPNTTNVGKADMDNPFGRGGKGISSDIMEAIGLAEDDSSFKLREVFGPRKGNQWTCVDYQQFQLRIFAVVSESIPLLEAFERGEDAHDAVARVLFSSDDISDVQRTAAKAINFGILFGAGPKKIELIAGMPGLYRTFTSRFPKAKIYLDKQADIAKRRGYVHTLNGYRLYVPRDRVYTASCYVIQGTEAQIVRHAMIELDRYNYDPNIKSPYKSVMMVHDELIFRSKVPTSRQRPRYDRHLNRMMNIMENCSEALGIPALVDAKVTSTNWAQRQDYELKRNKSDAVALAF